MKSKILGTLAALALMLAMGSFAKADTFTLDVQNGALPGTGPWGTVTVLGGGTSVTITFEAADGFIFHNAGVGWNENLALGAVTGAISNESVTTCVTVGGATCSAIASNSNFDGFGSGSANNYDHSVGGGNGSSSGITKVTITITGTNLELVDFESIENNKHAHFAAQVSPYPGIGGCTGFVADHGATPGTTSADPNCNPSTVPEPGSLMLFGTGLLSVAGFLRRRLFA